MYFYLREHKNRKAITFVSSYISSENIKTVKIFFSSYISSENIKTTKTYPSVVHTYCKYIFREHKNHKAITFCSPYKYMFREHKNHKDITQLLLMSVSSTHSYGSSLFKIAFEKKFRNVHVTYIKLFLIEFNFVS